MVMMPPRHGKSEYISRGFPAWFVGMWPDKRVILCSYEHGFAAEWGRKARDILTNYGHLFGTGVREDVAAQDRWETEQGGGMVTAGVGGAITGRGGHLMIIDDPHKNAEEAFSETMRQKVWDWWVSTFYTRREPGAKCVVIQTRWHEEDLIGKLLTQSDAAKWRVIRLPALAEEDDPLGRAEGEALWPARYSREELLKTKDSEDGGSYWWAALYQQSPVPIGEGLFRESWESHYQVSHDGLIFSLYKQGLPTPVLYPRSALFFFGMMDLAVSTKQTADYTVLSSFAITPANDLLLIDVDRRRLEAPEQTAMISKAIATHGLVFVGVESTAYQLSLVQYARNEALPVKAIRADKDKVARAMIASALQEAGKLYLPRSAPWLGPFRAELYSFPNGAHDDQVDPLSYAGIYTGKRSAQGNLG
jgi:predicted phage terminase large subunit-like protein